MVGWQAALFILVAGSFGGVANALMTDNGFIMPTSAMVDGHGQIWRPGMLGNVFVGAVAALVSWGLYGAAADASVIGAMPTDLKWAAVVGAILVGIGGSRWLTAEVDKSLLKGAASLAANRDKNAELAAKMAMLPPAAALEAVQKAP